MSSYPFKFFPKKFLCELNLGYIFYLHCDCIINYSKDWSFEHRCVVFWYISPMQMQKFKGINRSLQSLVWVLSIKQVSINEFKFKRSHHINNKICYLIINLWIIPWCIDINFQKRLFYFCNIVCSLKLSNISNRKLWGQNCTLWSRRRQCRGECVFRKATKKAPYQWWLPDQQGRHFYRIQRTRRLDVKGKILHFCPPCSLNIQYEYCCISLLVTPDKYLSK